MINCDYREWDAAYVLGALSEAETIEFESHLPDCPDCRLALTQLTPLPAMLGSVPPQDRPPAPATGAPRMSRRGWLAVAAGVVAGAAVGGAGGYALGHRPPPAATPRRIAFEAVTDVPIVAVVDVVPLRDGTELCVQCQYDPTDLPDRPEAIEYGIWAVNRRGHEVEVKRWAVKPNKINKPTGFTSFDPADLACIEVRLVSSGATVLRAPC